MEIFHVWICAWSHPTKILLFFSFVANNEPLLACKTVKLLLLYWCLLILVIFDQKKIQTISYGNGIIVLWTKKQVKLWIGQSNRGPLYKIQINIFLILVQWSFLILKQVCLVFCSPADSKSYFSMTALHWKMWIITNLIQTHFHIKIRMTNI